MGQLFQTSYILILACCLISCSMDNNTKHKMKEMPVMEVTTFNILPNTNQKEFALLDSQVELNFTSKQPGFIKRQCGVDDIGNYVVIVYWATTADADASMNKFMNDKAVSDYASKINGTTMQMARYTIDKLFDAEESQFIEIMSYNLDSGIDKAQFNITNSKVETEFTGKREGFIQRLIGEDDKGRQVVAVYWDTKSNSDASLPLFMEAPIAKLFMKSMDQSSLTMGRYELLK